MTAFKSPAAVNAALAPKSAGPQPASPTFTPGTINGPTAPPDAAGKSVSKDGLLLVPGMLTGEADIAAIEKK
jgi:hypothetical protein